MANRYQIATGNVPSAEFLVQEQVKYVTETIREALKSYIGEDPTFVLELFHDSMVEMCAVHKMQIGSGGIHCSFYVLGVRDQADPSQNDKLTGKFRIIKNDGEVTITPIFTPSKVSVNHLSSQFLSEATIECPIEDMNQIKEFMRIHG